MVTKERLQIIVDLSPFEPQQLITKISVGDKNVEIEAIDIDEKGNASNAIWSMPIKSSDKDEHTL